MQALQEVTNWEYPNHTYLLDGDRLVAYIKKGESEPFFFKNGIKGFSKSGRKFKEVSLDLFDATEEVESTLIAVAGSKGNTYYIDPIEHTCTCPGFQFRGDCKHVKELA